MSIKEDVEDVRINLAHNKANKTRITNPMRPSRKKGKKGIKKKFHLSGILDIGLG